MLLDWQRVVRGTLLCSAAAVMASCGRPDDAGAGSGPPAAAEDTLAAATGGATDGTNSSSSWGSDAKLAQFRVVERFGWGDISEATRELTPLERTVDGGVLGMISDVREGPDSALYVLDSHYHKIVVFNADGSLRRVILGAQGQGPGEFMRPRAMTMVRDSLLYVLDGADSRVTVFDTAGVYIRSFQLGVANPVRLEYSRGRLLVSRLAFAGRHAVLAFDQNGTRVDSLLVMSEPEGKLAMFGSPGVLGPGVGDTAVFASPSLGVWSLVDGPHVDTHGREMIPGLEGRMVRVGATPDVRVVPVSPMRVSGLPTAGQTQDMLAIYMEYDPDSLEGGTLTRHYYLARFDADGLRKDIMELADPGVPSMAISRFGNAFYVSVNSPYPRVLRYAR